MGLENYPWPRLWLSHTLRYSRFSYISRIDYYTQCAWLPVELGLLYNNVFYIIQIMDILYYSNYCKHSKNILAFLVKHDMVKSLNCLCVDKRKINQHNGQVQIIMENGASVVLPPNIHAVPALMLLKENYRVLLGNKNIADNFKSYISESNDLATRGNGEPMSFSLGSRDVVSEGFTMYGASPEELSTRGSGRFRNMHHYVSAEGVALSIQTPPENYKPNKLSEDVTIDSLEQKRSEDMFNTLSGTNQTPFLPQ